MALRGVAAGPALLGPTRALLRALFRVRRRGWAHWPGDAGGVLVCANHASFLDGVLLAAFLPRPPVFVVNTRVARRWWARPFLAVARHVTIDPTSPMYLKTLVQLLREGEAVAIFPEGRVSVTGALMKVYEGPAVAADRAAVPVLPVGISGAELSLFARPRPAVRRRPFPAITLAMSAARRLDPGPLAGRERRARLGRLLADLMVEAAYAREDIGRPLFQALAGASRRHGRLRPVLEDPERRTLGYLALFARAFVLARLLGRAGLRERRVGLLLPSAVGAVVAFLALHLRGRTPVVLNFTAGSHALLAACETAEAGTVLSSRAFVEGAGLGETVRQLADRVRVLYLEDLAAGASLGARLWGLACALRPEAAFRRLAGPVPPEAPAVVLFTSGSEGLPKGVALSHRNLLANHAQVSAALALVPADRVLNALPVFHSFGLSTGTLVPLLSGMRVLLYPSPLHYHLIPELAYQLDATVVFGTSTFLAGYGRHADPYDFHAARLVVAGAEPLKDEVRRLWAERFGIRVTEGYGVTEASPVLAANTLRHHRIGTVGRLLPGIEHYLEPVEGIEDGGRLCVRGANVMLGYLLHDRPGELVAPSTARGEGWYDTGDVVRIDGDGFITIAGRAKRFAKIGGEMVSLAAVEALAEAAWPELQHAATGLPDAAKGEQIALLTTHPAPSRRELVRHARRLGYGEVHIPRRLIAVDEIPMLASGKRDYGEIRRAALAALPPAGPDAEAARSA